MSRDAYLLDGVRTPRGKGSPKGALASVAPLDLLGVVLGELARRHPKVRALGDDLVVGCATQVDGQGTNPARTAALRSGWGQHLPGVTVNRFCASGIDAVNLAAARVARGDSSLVFAGGLESVSSVPMFADRGPLYCDPALVAELSTVHMGTSADLVATREGFTRDALDRYAHRTREKARAAVDGGRLARSIVAVPVAGGRSIDRDELASYAPTLDELAAMPAAFAEIGRDGDDARVLGRFPELAAVAHLHTRGTSPQLADAAALLVVGDRVTAERAELRPRARIVATATCAVDPVEMLTGGQLATERALEKASLRPSDVAVFEFAEAFSALCLKFQRDLDVGDDRFNPNGGTMALGHAFGATGAILLVQLIDELERRGERFGVAAVSGAAGLGIATVVERID